MNRRVTTYAVCIGLCSPALAVEWSMDTTLRETVELSDNPFMLNPPASGVGSHSTWLGHVTGQTKTSRFDFDADFTYNKYWGPAAAVGGALAETTDNGVKMHYETFGPVPRDRNYIDASWRRSSAAGAILTDLGVATNVKGDIHTTTIQGGIDRSLSATDLWTWSARASSIDYDPRGIGTQYVDAATTSTFRHQSNSTSALTGMTEFEWLRYDNATETNVMIIRYMAGVDLQPHRLLSFVASAGAATVITEQGTQPLVVNPFAPVAASGIASDFIGDARLTYKFLPTAELVVTAGQSIGPTVIGALATRSYAGARVNYTINPLESVSASIDLTRQVIATTQTDFLTAAATYSKTLARDWTLDLTYRYSHRHATAGSTGLTVDPITGLPIVLGTNSTSNASANTILMVLSKRFVLLPKRT